MRPRFWLPITFYFGRQTIRIRAYMIVPREELISLVDLAASMDHAPTV
jgi:hypothetical protein